MDIAPPQAPPAITRSAQRESVDTLNRIVVLGHWLHAQQQAMPHVDDVLASDARVLHGQALARYWTDLVDDGERPVERRTLVAERLAGLAGHAAKLMAQDGSLDAAAASTIDRIATTADIVPPGLRLDEVTLHGKALAGALVVRDDASPDRTLLFTPDRGWASFDNVDAMYRDIERHARFATATRVDLRGLDRLDTDEAMDAFAIALRPLADAPWQALTERLITLQQEKTDQAWFEDRLRPSSPLRAIALADRLREATRLDDLIDVDALLAVREETLHRVVQAERLAHVPAGHRQDWMAAADAYRDAHALAKGLSADRGLGAPRDLPTFAAEAPVKALLREQYAVYLDTLRTGPTATLRRDLSLGLSVALMRLRAEEARLAYVVPGHTAAFRHDFAERGYQWVRAVLDAPTPTHRRRVEGHEVVASQVVIEGQPVEGVMVIGARQHRAVSSVLLYLPDAPDGRHFREFDDWNEAVRHVFDAPAFHDYLIDRLPGITVGLDASPRIVRREMTGDVFHALWQTALDATTHLARITDEAETEPSPLPRVLTAPFTAPTPPWVEQVDASTPASQRVARSVLSWVTRPFRSGMLGMALPGAHGAGLTSLRTMESIVGVFDDAFRARGVAARGKPDVHGLHTIDGRTYVVHRNQLYGARYDSAFDTVRLHRPGTSPTSYGPAIRRDGTDRWTSHSVGLRGGRHAPPDDFANQRTSLREHARIQGVGMAQLRNQVLDAPAGIAPPAAPALPPAVPVGHRLLAAHELPDRVHAVWFRAPNHVSGMVLPEGFVRYLRMDVQTLAAGNRGVPVRSMPAPAEPGNRAQSIVINLRNAHARLDNAGQPRFDVYRSDIDPQAIVLRPRGPGALEFRNEEFLTTGTPANYFPAAR